MLINECVVTVWNAIDKQPDIHTLSIYFQNPSEYYITRGCCSKKYEQHGKQYISQRYSVRHNNKEYSVISVNYNSFEIYIAFLTLIIFEASKAGKPLNDWNVFINSSFRYKLKLVNDSKVFQSMFQVK